jgi:hypothetical protein
MDTPPFETRQSFFQLFFIARNPEEISRCQSGPDVVFSRRREVQLNDENFGTLRGSSSVSERPPGNWTSRRGLFYENKTRHSPG